MRILQVDKFLRRQGGAASYMLDLADLQVAAGHEVAFLAAADPANLPPRDDRHFVPAPTMDPPPPGLGAKAIGAARFVWNRQAAAGLEAVVREFRPDAVHLHNIYHHLTPSILWRLRRHDVPVVMTLHDYKLVCPSYRLLADGAPCTACLDNRFRHAVQKRCKDGSLLQSGLMAAETRLHRTLRSYDRVDAFVAPSRFMVEVLGRAGVGGERVHHVPHFVDLDRLPPATPPAEGVAYVGRLSPEKGLGTLLDAIGQAPGTSLTVVGDGELRADLEAQAARVAPGRVTFTGQVDRDGVLAALAAAAVFVLPSEWYENQPMSILEAMAMGRVPVVTDLGGNPELVEPGTTGWLVPPGDAATLAGVLTDALVDPARLARMGAAARRAVADGFAPGAHLERLDALYSSRR